MQNTGEKYCPVRKKAAKRALQELNTNYILIYLRLSTVRAVYEVLYFYANILINHFSLSSAVSIHIPRYSETSAHKHKNLLSFNTAQAHVYSCNSIREP